MYSLRKLSESVSLTSELITYQIKEKYKYLVVTNTTFREDVINTKNFVSALYDNGVVTLILKYDEFKADLNKSDILGYTSGQELLHDISIENINKLEGPFFKLIFSPQISRALLKAGYKMVDIKPRKDNPDEVVFIFEVEDGFYDVIENWKKEKEY